jgi:hypothetical protein
VKFVAKFYESIGENIAEFIAAQHVFFVATAPLSAEGHVNLSPKGHDCFRVLGPNRVAYLDLTGSGNETSAHVRENGRITFMFCAFDGPPNIVRLFGTGSVVLPGDTEWDPLSALFPSFLGTRQIVTADIHKVQTSCGFAVPFMDYAGERDQLDKWAAHKGEEGLVAYWCEKNTTSVDGLPTPLGAALVRRTADGG